MAKKVRQKQPENNVLIEPNSSKMNQKLIVK